MSELFEYWKDYPPVHLLVSAYLIGDKGRGYKNERKQDADFVELRRVVVSAGGGIFPKLPDSYRG